MTADLREQALAKRHASQRERLTEHTKVLPPLQVGDSVYIQNQVGNSPNKWDKSGKIVEVKPFDQYNVKVDCSNRLTLRNRRFLRHFLPFPGQVLDARTTGLEHLEVEENESSTKTPTPNDNAAEECKEPKRTFDVSNHSEGVLMTDAD